ncbi:MAG: hypothetical protein NHB14_03400 [Desulfosporosinus sp.]|nr:hypothetical protein [Desulfosporosinus sp.]
MKALNKDVAVKGLEGWVACFGKAKLSGVIRGEGVTDIGDIQHNEMLLSEAYKMGKQFRICRKD